MKKGEAVSALDKLGIDAFCNAVLSRKSMSEYAKDAGVSIGTLIAWLDSDPERSARAREARTKTARLWDEQAEAELRGATTPHELGIAKELAHHYRWRAAKIAPRDYGEKVQTEVTGPNGGPVQSSVTVTMTPVEAYLTLKNGGQA